MLTIIIISVLLILLGILGVFIEKTTLGDHQKEDDFPVYGTGHKRRQRASLRRQSSNVEDVVAAKAMEAKEEGGAGGGDCEAADGDQVAEQGRAGAAFEGV